MDPLPLAVHTKIAGRIFNVSGTLNSSVIRAKRSCLLSLLLVGVFGIQSASSEVSVAESPEFELDLRPPGSNPDAISVAESGWFELDLSAGISFAESASFILDLRDPRDPGYEAWLDQYFSEAEKLVPSVTDEDADPDLDGLDNWFEYIAQLDPRDRGSYLRIHYTSIERDHFRFSPVSETLIYDVQYSEDLEAWTSFDESRLSLLENEMEVDTTGLPENLFHRVQITNPNITVEE